MTRTAAVAAVLLVLTAIVYLGVAQEAPGLDALARWVASWFGGDGPSDTHTFVLANIRAPRLLVAAFGGAALALAGAVMQATFRNPLAAEPTGMYQIFQMRQRLSHGQHQVHAFQLTTKHQWQHLHRELGLGARGRKFVQLLQVMAGEIVDPLPQSAERHAVRWQHQRVF